MTTEQQIILQILSASLKGEKFGNLPSSSVNWEAFLLEAKKQGVSSLLYFNMEQTAIPEEIKSHWEKMAFQDLRSSFRVIDAHVKICELFEAESIPVVTFKGYASADYYPDPLYRSMGDVDFYVEEDLREKARKVLVDNGYVEEDLNRHHDWLYQKAGILYELHFAISGVPRGNEGEPFRRALKGIVTERKWTQSKVGKIAIPSDFHHGLIILLHTASHLMAGGLGLRHLCDWAVFVNHFDDDEFRQIFQERFEELRIWRFAQVLTKVCEKYLGLCSHEWVGEVDVSSVDKLMREFLDTGDYSAYHVSRQSDLMASEGFSVRVGHRSGLGNLLAVLRNSVEYHWPRTQNNKLLLVLGMVFSAVRYFIRIIIGKRKKLDFMKMNREANERRELYRQFGLVDGFEDE